MAPYTGLTVVAVAPNSGLLVRPITMAPAARRRSTTVSSVSSAGPSAYRREPEVVTCEIHTAVFPQSSQIQDELYSPLLYRYSVMAPGFGGEKVVREINTGNGYARVLFGAGDAPGVVSFIMTNIPPVMPQAVAAMRARPY